MSYKTKRLQPYGWVKMGKRPPESTRRLIISKMVKILWGTNKNPEHQYDGKFFAMVGNGVPTVVLLGDYVTPKITDKIRKRAHSRPDRWVPVKTTGNPDSPFHPDEYESYERSEVK